ncbi:hypothetical protein C3Y98_05175 [Methylotenera oryzisoli]|uniref:Uncharacterized protein n=1 Tax=Methylotenera oryzisoli TaxID=2080758 RepID=A0A4Y9VRP0_9PROT|nr:hypothetical protein [Methylotenera oryzisoli]TFW71490.1 hypothetical protein C3Y98_05175 [Methylotenera oryzisoli]
MSITAWYYIDTNLHKAAVMVSAPIGSGNNLALTTKQARELAKELIDSADDLDHLVNKLGLQVANT